MTKILVTGATGTVGSELVKVLSARSDVSVVAAVRKDTRSNFPAGVVPALFDYADPAKVRAALEGVDALFLLTPMTADIVDRAKATVDAAKAARVSRIVKLSAFGAELEDTVTWARSHRAVERHIEASGLAWTLLRPNNFMQNVINFSLVGPDDVIYAPWGDAAVSFIDVRDVAAAAAVALTGAGHARRAYTLTGPAAISLGHVAAVLSEVTGRNTRYVDIPEAAARKALIDLHWPAEVVDGMMELHAFDKAGRAAVVTDDLKTLLGRAPITFEQFARDHQVAWRK